MVALHKYNTTIFSPTTAIKPGSRASSSCTDCGKSSWSGCELRPIMGSGASPDNPRRTSMMEALVSLAVMASRGGSTSNSLRRTLPSNQRRRRLRAVPIGTATARMVASVARIYIRRSSHSARAALSGRRSRERHLHGRLRSPGASLDLPPWRCPRPPAKRPVCASAHEQAGETEVDALVLVGDVEEAAVVGYGDAFYARQGRELADEFGGEMPVRGVLTRRG